MRGLGPRSSRYSVNPAASQLLLHDRKKKFAVRVVYIQRHIPSLPLRLSLCLLLPDSTTCAPLPTPLPLCVMFLRRPFPGFACTRGQINVDGAPRVPFFCQPVLVSFSATGSICPYLSVCPRDFFSRFPMHYLDRLLVTTLIYIPVRFLPRHGGSPSALRRVATSHHDPTNPIPPADTDFCIVLQQGSSRSRYGPIRFLASTQNGRNVRYSRVRAINTAE